jgi:O-antigen/teichoic acid export membrane protein
MTSSDASIKKLAVRGAIWTILGYGASQSLRLVNNLILTRLLVPELFGVMSLLYTFLMGLHLLSDIGINVSIIQNKRGDDPDFLNTAWTMQIIRGFLIWGGCIIIAYPIAQLYNKPELMWLLPIVGLGTLINTFNNTVLHSMNRHMAIRQIAIIEFVGQVISICVMILWALVSPSIWALVVGGITSALYELGISYYLAKGKMNRFMWEPTAVRELLSFGVWLFLSTAITFFAERADQLILSRLVGFEMFGIYIIAFTLADLPRSVTSAVSSKVIMPALSKMTDQPRPDIRQKLNGQRKRVLVVLAAGLALLAAFGDVLIKILYSSYYAPASWMLPILAVGIWPRLLSNTNEPVLFAIGKPQYTAAANFSRFLSTAVGIWAGYSILGLPGAIIGVALNDLVYYVIINYGLKRESFSGIYQDVLATVLMLGILGLLLVIRYSLGFGTPLDGML